VQRLRFDASGDWLGVLLGGRVLVMTSTKARPVIVCPINLSKNVLHIEDEVLRGSNVGGNSEFGSKGTLPIII
jgi:hypothetical protein